MLDHKHKEIVTKLEKQLEDVASDLIASQSLEACMAQVLDTNCRTKYACTSLRSDLIDSLALMKSADLFALSIPTRSHWQEVKKLQEELDVCRVRLASQEKLCIEAQEVREQVPCTCIGDNLPPTRACTNVPVSRGVGVFP